MAQRWEKAQVNSFPLCFAARCLPREIWVPLCAPVPTQKQLWIPRILHRHIVISGLMLFPCGCHHSLYRLLQRNASLILVDLVTGPQTLHTPYVGLNLPISHLLELYI